MRASHHGSETRDPVWWELQRKAAEEKRRAESEKENQQARERQKFAAEQAEMRRLAENLGQRKRKRIILLVLAFAIVVGGITLVLGVIVLVSMQTKSESGQYSADRNPTPMSTQKTEQGASPPPAKASSQTTPGRQQARTTEPGNEIPAQPEQSKGPDVWHVATIVNRTNGTIPYLTLVKDGDRDRWLQYNLPAGLSTTHTSLNRNINIKYDYKYETGYQEQQQTLEGTTVVGHEPNLAEKQKATIYYFIVENGDIVMHRQP